MKVLAASTSFVDSNFKMGWAAVGDAALAVDPLSGEGVIRSLDQGIEVVPSIADYLDGDSSGIVRLRESFKASVVGYLEARRSVFSMETRWPSSPFWRRRRELLSVDTPRST